jgi:hypothetical protein
MSSPTSYHPDCLLRVVSNTESNSFRALSLCLDQLIAPALASCK